MQKNDCAPKTEWPSQEVSHETSTGHLCFSIMKAWTRAEFQTHFGATPEQLQVKVVELTSEAGQPFKGVLTIDEERPDRYCFQFGLELAKMMKVLMGVTSQIHEGQASETFKHELSTMEDKRTKTFLKCEDIQKRADLRAERMAANKPEGDDEDEDDEDMERRTTHSFAPALAAAKLKTPKRRCGGIASLRSAGVGVAAHGGLGAQSVGGESGEFQSPGGGKVLYTIEHARFVINKVTLTSVMSGSRDGRSCRPVREWGEKYAAGGDHLKSEADMLLLHADRVDHALALVDGPRLARDQCSKGWLFPWRAPHRQRKPM